MGEIDLATAALLAERVHELSGAGFTHIVIDLRGLTFLDASGLRLLLTLHRDAEREGWRLSLLQGSRAIRRVFEITGMLNALPFTSPSRLVRDGTAPDLDDHDRTARRFPS